MRRQNGLRGRYRIFLPHQRQFQLFSLNVRFSRLLRNELNLHQHAKNWLCLFSQLSIVLLHRANGSLKNLRRHGALSKAAAIIRHSCEVIEVYMFIFSHVNALIYIMLLSRIQFKKQHFSPPWAAAWTKCECVIVAH